METRLGDTRNKIWHSTYYSLFEKWYGPCVITVYDMIYERFPEFFVDSKEVISLKQNSITRADAIICISHTTRQDLIEKFPASANKSHVISLGLSLIYSMRDLDKIRFKRRKPFILYLGSRAKYKGFKDLLLAYSQWNMSSEIELVVVGSPMTESEHSEIFSLNLQEKITYLSQVDDNNLCDLYNQALAFVYPSLFEGFGIPLLEAMACGCPIVASNIPSTIEVAGNIPFYFESGNIDSLIVALDQVLSEGRSTLRMNSGIYRTKAFTWECNARQTLEVYHSLS